MKLYVVFDGPHEDAQIITITDNIELAAFIYFSERGQVNGNRPYVYSTILNNLYQLDEVLEDELRNSYKPIAQVKGSK